MPRRTFWLVTGVALGAGSSLWAERKIRRTVADAAARLQPDSLASEVGRAARASAGRVGERVRDALETGREEMRRREEQLWEGLAGGGPEGGPGAGRGSGPLVPGSEADGMGLRRTAGASGRALRGR